jgi:LmbE family N-acetylglucosaminyl deacetylase
MMKALKKKVIKTFNRYIKTPRFANRYFIGATITLGLSTVCWAIIGSIIQLGNADQLANASLLKDPATFNGSLLPDQHTFLLKLPFFYLIQLLGATPFAYCFVTVLAVLITVGALAFILWRIERRPLYIGTIFLLLAACLIFIPTEPYAGALLPTSFSMITTRNIEYIIFILSLIGIIRAKTFPSLYFIGASVLLILLVASDKLFLSLSLGGAVISSIVYFVAKRRQLMWVSLRWLVASMVGAAGGTILLWAVNKLGFIHTSTSIGAGPYAVVHNLRDFFLGVVYGVAGIFTNFGANPAYDTRVAKDLPAQLLAGLFKPGGLGFLVTIAITICVLIVAYTLFIKSITTIMVIRKNNQQHPLQLSLMLLWTSIVAVGVFVVSNHYYPVDSRYETIVLFAGFIALATFLAQRKLKPQTLVVAGSVTFIALFFSLPFLAATYSNNTQATTDITTRNTYISQVLKLHPVNTLVGDYWRVLPIAASSSNKISITPTEGCTTLRNVLSSKAWQPDLKTHSFAYLLTFESSSTGYPACSLDVVTAIYGKPNTSTLIKGTIQKPQELLLFFDHGIKLPKHNAAPFVQDTVVPRPLSSLKNTTCEKTIMNFVAHQDDDILFLSPDLIHDIRAGHCIRTVYLTAGDDGAGEAYWIGRQRGAEAAYNSMIGNPNQSWVERIIEIDKGHFAMIANPKGNTSISLLFLHLPDGNVGGSGFTTGGYESLSKLAADRINVIHSIDKSSSYTPGQLVNLLVTIMHTYQPTNIRSQGSYRGIRYKDHSDHNATAFFVARSYATYNKTYPEQLVPTMTYYLGYPVHSLAPNVSGEDLTQKTAAFLAFSKFDGAVCHSVDECNTRTVYGIYLTRQYTNTN